MDCSIPCALLDGTGGIQCTFKGPYKWSRAKPSRARIVVEGDKETSEGVVSNSPFLMCEPAEARFAHLGTPGTQFTYEWLVKQQCECTKYKER